MYSCVLQNEVDIELSGERVDREVLPVHAHLREEVQLVAVELQQLQVVLRLLRDAYLTQENTIGKRINLSNPHPHLHAQSARKTRTRTRR